MQNNKLQSQIMRRVYYAFALRALASRQARYFGLLAVLCVVFMQFVSVPDVLRNIADIKVRDVLPYIFNSLLSTEIWNVLMLIAMAAAFVAFVRSIASTEHQMFDTYSRV